MTVHLVYGMVKVLESKFVIIWYFVVLIDYNWLMNFIKILYISLKQ